MRPASLIMATLLWCALLAAMLQAADTPAPLPAGGTLLTPESALASYSVMDVSRRYATFELQSDSSGAKFLRAGTTSLPPRWWDVQLHWPGSAPIRKGDTLLLSLRMRTVSAQNPTGEASCNACVQRTSSPWDSVVNFDFHVGTQWRRIDLPVRAQGDFAAGEYQVALNLGFGVQSVDIADVLLLNYGPDVQPSALPRLQITYPGREADAPWRKEAQKRISELRMADLKVQVVDAAGQPVPAAQVHAKMLRHTFPFGTNVVAAQLDPQDSSSDARKYREMLANLFNRVQFESEMNWVEWETNRGRIADHKARLWRCVEWLEQHKLAIRGHSMLWPGWTSGPAQVLPEDLRPLVEAKDVETLRERIRARIMEIGGEFQGHLADWDVVNEPTANHVLQDALGPQAIIEWFQWARRVDPKARLYVNDFSILSGGAVDEQRMNRFEELLKSLKAAGAPVDGIGEEAHFASTPAGPERMLALLDRFGAPGLPLQITQFDHASDDEQLQADYLRDFYTAAFSHPAISGITMQGFWEGRHKAPTAALWRKDWSIKPSGQVFLELTHKQWWTDVQGTTDERGAYATRGFLGDYEITVVPPAGGTLQTTTVRLTRSSPTLVVRANR